MTVTEDVAAVTWDLGHLVDGRGDAAVAGLLDEADRRAAELSAYRGKVGDLDAPGLDPSLRGAELLAGGRAGRTAGHARRGAVPPAGPVPRRAQDGGWGHHGSPRPRTAHASLRLQHPPAGQGGRRPPAPLSALAGQ